MIKTTSLVNEEYVEFSVYYLVYHLDNTTTKISCETTRQRILHVRQWPTVRIHGLSTKITLKTRTVMRVDSLLQMP